MKFNWGQTPFWMGSVPNRTSVFARFVEIFAR